MEVAGRTALITGGAAGTGRAIAHRLDAEGAHVIVADLERGDIGRFVKLDAADPDPRLFAGVDILVNNAGGGHWPPHYPEPGWEAKLDLNLRGPLLATQFALERGTKTIVNIASSAGHETTRHAFPEYAIAKAGLIRFTTAYEPPPGVRINCVSPGWILTERAERELAAMTPQERAAAPPAIPLDTVVDAVMRLIADETLNHQVVVLWRGRQRSP
ncbi:SDR family NAD(P)-dependent oxidoreductase [Solirubrobacter soli]|uniref:SDR family NAD(P)-dependent oxidoreductase n=1 Tax=Solirubrobacter soli TaxID=363832 RepID=UPI0003FD189B|nr:SDR family oxidoreductase [Solirubrobacter soli]